MIGMTVCSGIGAPEHAAPWVDWRYQSEIEKFPSAVLRERFPSAENLGDMTAFKEWPDANLDVLCGGTPCQSFSVAGLRAGLDDPRGQLMLTYLAIAGRYRPKWIVWENVPGALSANGGRAFASFLRGLELLGYHAAWRVLDVQYGQTLRFPWAIPQRRKRLFVVGCLGDWRSAAEVLLEPQSLSRNPPPRREAGKAVAPCLSARTKSGGGLGTDFDLGGGLVANTLRGEGFDASEDGTGRQNLVPVANSGEVAMCLTASAQNSLDAETETLIAFDCKGSQAQTDATGVAPTLRAMSSSKSHANAGGQLAVAIQERAVSENPDAGPDGIGVSADGSAYTIEARHRPQAVAFETTQITSVGNYSNPKPGDPCHPLAAGAHPPAIALPWAVRRLTPTECERLMGFPDGWTKIGWRGKPPSLCPDGPRYKALGNSWGVNCGEYVFDRLRMVEGITKEGSRAPE